MTESFLRDVLALAKDWVAVWQEIPLLAKEYLGLERQKLSMLNKQTQSDGASSSIESEIPVADESDRYDPKVFGKMPRGWNGRSFEGAKFSETDPEFLRLHARSLWGLAKWQDDNGKLDQNGKPKSNWTRKDAGRALRWAKRLEETRPVDAQQPLAPAKDDQVSFYEYTDDQVNAFPF